MNPIVLRQADQKEEVYLASHHLPATVVQSEQALARILEIEALLQDIFFFQSVQGVSDCSCRKIGMLRNILLRQKAAGFQHFENKLC